MTYAIIRTGGKQVKVAAGDIVAVERLEGETGADISFDEVLLLSQDGEATVGSPTVEGAKVSATILEQGRAKKILVFKMKRRKGYRKLRGHRQQYTRVRITGIAN